MGDCRRARGSGAVTVGALSLTETVSWGVLYYAFAVLLPPMSQEASWTTAVVSAAFSTGLTAAALAAPVVGRALYRFGPRAVMTTGSTVAAASLQLWAAADSAVTLHLAWVGIGLGMSATLYEPAFATVVGYHRPQQRRAIVVITLFGGLAATIFQPLTQALSAAGGWREAVRILSAVLAVLTIPAHALLLPRGPRVTPPGEHPLPQGDERDDGSTRRAVRHLTVAFTMATGTSAGLTAHLVAFLAASGMTLTTAAVMSSALGVAKTAGRLLVTPLSRTRTPLALATSALLLQGLAVAVPVISTHAAALVVHIALFGAASGALTVLRPWATDAVVGPARFASVDGKVQMPVALCKAAGPAAVGVVLSLTGGYRSAWAAAAVAAVAAGWSTKRAAHSLRRKAMRPSSRGHVITTRPDHDPGSCT